MGKIVKLKINNNHFDIDNDGNLQTKLKTINNNDLHGTGDVVITGGDVDKAYVDAQLALKQDTLVSVGEKQNIKTINGENLLGQGNIEITGGTDVTKQYVDDQDTKILNDAKTYTETQIAPLATKAEVATKAEIADLLWEKKGDNVELKIEAGLRLQTPLEITSDKNNPEARVLSVNSTGAIIGNILGHPLLTITNSIVFYDNNLNPLVKFSPLTKIFTYKDVEIANIDDLSNKQDTLVSGTNIKTINGQTILGSGDLEISGGGTGDVTKEYVDTQLALKQNINDDNLTTTDKTVVGAINELKLDASVMNGILQQTVTDTSKNAAEIVTLNTKVTALQQNALTNNELQQLRAMLTQSAFGINKNTDSLEYKGVFTPYRVYNDLDKPENNMVTDDAGNDLNIRARANFHYAQNMWYDEDGNVIFENYQGKLTYKNVEIATKGDGAIVNWTKITDATWDGNGLNYLNSYNKQGRTFVIWIKKGEVIQPITWTWNTTRNNVVSTYSVSQLYEGTLTYSVDAFQKDNNRTSIEIKANSGWTPLIAAENFLYYTDELMDKPIPKYSVMKEIAKEENNAN